MPLRIVQGFNDTGDRGCPATIAERDVAPSGCGWARGAQVHQVAAVAAAKVALRLPKDGDEACCGWFSYVNIRSDHLIPEELVDALLVRTVRFCASRSGIVPSWNWPVWPFK